MATAQDTSAILFPRERRLLEAGLELLRALRAARRAREAALLPSERSAQERLTAAEAELVAAATAILGVLPVTQALAREPDA